MKSAVVAVLFAALFGCHAAWASTAPETSRMVSGVWCERCHGPGATHAAKPAAINIRDVGRLDAPGQVIDH